ncbi:hypothetical protein KXV48_001427, partial [Aspergillus fumigatus]
YRLDPTKAQYCMDWEILSNAPPFVRGLSNQATGNLPHGFSYLQLEEQVGHNRFLLKSRWEDIGR